tara:strand:+ start:1047 stop:1256 length:210 start_codon:yes stop_codon:yes gene_type:complete
MENILSSKGYKLIVNNINGQIEESTDTIYRLYDGASVSLERKDSIDYEEYLKWLEEGNTPEPADEPETE